jgi:hypothetical protein
MIGPPAVCAADYSARTAPPLHRPPPPHRRLPRCRVSPCASRRSSSRPAARVRVARWFRSRLAIVAFDGVGAVAQGDIRFGCRAIAAMQAAVAMSRRASRPSISASRRVNQHLKCVRLPSAAALERARDAMLAWWHGSYLSQLGEVHPAHRPLLSANQDATPPAKSPLRRQNPREEPGALAAHAGICAGGGE